MWQSKICRQHVVTVLMIDANQSTAECIHNQQVKPYTIVWLMMEQWGTVDPFQTIMGNGQYLPQCIQIGT